MSWWEFSKWMRKMKRRNWSKDKFWGEQMKNKTSEKIKRREKEIETDWRGKGKKKKKQKEDNTRRAASLIAKRGKGREKTLTERPAVSSQQPQPIALLIESLSLRDEEGREGDWHKQSVTLSCRCKNAWCDSLGRRRDTVKTEGCLKISSKFIPFLALHSLWRRLERGRERKKQRKNRTNSINRQSILSIPIPFHRGREKARIVFLCLYVSASFCSLVLFNPFSFRFSFSHSYAPRGAAPLLHFFTFPYKTRSEACWNTKHACMYVCMNVWMNGWIEGSRNEMKQKWLTVYCRHTHFAIWIDDVQKQGRGTRQRRIWSGRRELTRAWQSDNDRFLRLINNLEINSRFSLLMRCTKMLAEFCAKNIYERGKETRRR